MMLPEADVKRMKTSYRGEKGRGSERGDGGLRQPDVKKKREREREREREEKKKREGDPKSKGHHQEERAL